MDQYFADTLPEHKADHIRRLRDDGRFVCFVGDGINDAVALKSAQVSISLKGASSAATDAAQVIFMDGKPPAEFDDACDLIAHGHMDSLRLMGLVSFIAQHYGLQFGINDMVPKERPICASLAAAGSTGSRLLRRAPRRP